MRHIADVKKQGPVKLRGWVYRIRKGKAAVFIMLRDATGIIQCVAKEEAYDGATSLTIESSVEVWGEAKRDKRAPTGWEVQVQRIKPIQIAERFPITRDKSTELLLDNRHLWLRSQEMVNALKARHYLLKYMREWFDKNNFWEVHAPIITQQACEGGSMMFPFKYFDQKAFLSESGQLYLEAFITGLERVYALTPSFRAEKSRTVRHLAEYWHLEAEEAFVDNEGNMKIMENLISNACQRIAKEHPELLEYFGVEPKEMKAVKPPFKRVPYSQMVDTLQSKGLKIQWGDDPGAEDEKVFTEKMKKPVFVHHYPAEDKAFYMRRDPEDPDTLLNCDLLAPRGHGELVGGSERIWELDEMLKALKTYGLKQKDYAWFIDLRRYGSVPHSGFGLGVERLVKWILNRPHIRDVVGFPRTINRAYP